MQLVSVMEFFRVVKWSGLEMLEGGVRSDSSFRRELLQDFVCKPLMAEAQ